MLVGAIPERGTKRGPKPLRTLMGAGKMTVKLSAPPNRAPGAAVQAGSAESSNAETRSAKR
jgi:hypothetical protein